MAVGHVFHADLLVLDVEAARSVAFEHLACQNHAQDHEDAHNGKVPGDYVHVYIYTLKLILRNVLPSEHCSGKHHMVVIFSVPLRP